MRKMIFIVVMFAICCAELLIGGQQVGLYRLPITPTITMVAILVCYLTLAMFFGTWLGDKLVLKYYHYDSKNGYQRWSYYSCGDYHTADGVGLRLVIYIILLLPLIYTTVLLCYK